MRVFSRLKKGKKIWDNKFLRHYLELFLGGRSYGNSQEFQVTGTFVGLRLNTVSKAHGKKK
jgi:hypothetical protein